MHRTAALQRRRTQTYRWIFASFAMPFSALALAAVLSHARDKVTFFSGWIAQAGHGGSCQAIARLQEKKPMNGGGAAKLGIGVVTEKRRENTCDSMVGSGPLKTEVDFRLAFTAQFAKT